MHIKQLSAALDTKLQQLEQQLKKLHHQRSISTDASEQEQFSRDITALTQIRGKLIKSKDLAWRAHNLQKVNDEAQRTRQRLLGLLLCSLSVVCAGFLLAFALIG